MPDPSPTSVGTLFAIGGAEAKLRRRTVLRAFVAAAGGADARIAVVPTASSLGPEVIEVYRAVFASLGAGEVVALRPESRAEAQDPAVAAPLAGVTGRLHDRRQPAEAERLHHRHRLRRRRGARRTSGARSSAAPRPGPASWPST